MGIIRKIVTASMIFVLALSILSILGAQVCPVSANPIPAHLTGVISDEGIDTDGSGYFEYLYVGVEVEVTEPGLYYVYLGGLRDTDDYYISVSDFNSTYLDTGIRVVDLYLYGPEIHDSGRNPVLISHVILYKVEYLGPYQYLDSRWDVPLSEEYSYTEFDAPFTDMEARFTVYPDGRVLLGGAIDYAYPVPHYTGPEMHSVVGFTKSGDLTLASANCTFIIPPKLMSQLPFDLSTVSFLAEYSGGLLDVQIDCSLTVREPGASEFPFNMTDFTITGEYSDNELIGKIVIHLLPGIERGDIDIDFRGNRTDFSVTGSAEVVYGTYLGYELNAASLEALLMMLDTFPGRGPGSLYNMTNGLLECTKLTTTMTPFPEAPDLGATVDLEVHIHGDFVHALASMMSGSDPSMYPLFYSTLNATLNSVKSVSFQVAYTHHDKQASATLSLVDDAQGLWEDIVSLLPKVAPPEIKTLIEALFARILCTFHSAKVSLTYGDAKADLKVTVAIEGDLNAELNYLKTCLINYLNETGIGPPQPPTKSFTLIMDEWAFNETNPTITVNREDLVKILLINNGELEHGFMIDELGIRSEIISPGASYTLMFSAYRAGNFTYLSPVGDDRTNGMEGKFIVLEEPSPPLPPPPLPWQLLFLNETEIDISGLKLSFSVKETSVTGNLEGLAVLPPIDVVNATSFKLERLFNLTKSLGEPPTEGQKLKVIVEGGSNTTHWVTLVRPGTVPEPDETDPNRRSMVWYNQSISDLKDLVFTVSLQGFIVKWDGEEYPVITLSNSTITDFDFSQPDKKISLTVEGPPGTIGYCDITIPHRLLGGPYLILVNGLPPHPDPIVTSNATHTFIHLTYHHSTVRISITGTTVIQEFSNIVMPMFTIATLVATVLIKAIQSTRHKRKLENSVKF